MVYKLLANGREDSDDDVDVEDSFPPITSANGLPVQPQLQALYSSRGQTTAATSKTVSTRHHPPVSIATPSYSRWVSFFFMFLRFFLYTHPDLLVCKYLAARFEIDVYMELVRSKLLEKESL